MGKAVVHNFLKLRCIYSCCKMFAIGRSLVVQGLGLGAFTAAAQL